MEKGEINFLWFVTDVDEYEEAGQLLALQDVTTDHCFQLFHRLFTTLCIAVAWEIDDVPLFVDEEMVDAHGFARGGGGECQILPASEGIDERGFAYVASSDEGVFGTSVDRALGMGWLRANVGGGVYFRRCIRLSQKDGANVGIIFESANSFAKKMTFLL